MPRAISFADLPAVPAARLAVGLIQGLLLYLLYSAADAKAWPSSQAIVFAPLVLVACFVPLILLNGVGNLRWRTLLAWTAIAAALLAGLAAHDVARAAPDVDHFVWYVLGGHSDAAIWPSSILVFFTAVALFIGHSLIAAGDAEHRIIASYPRYFDVAWKHGVQVALSVVFVGLFWGLLELGAALFKLINIDFFERLLQHRWFSLPATTLAFACALHVTDTRAGIVRGMRVLVHVLLSWLLPLMALFVAGFLASLPFTGLAPLWATRFATSLLLTTSAALVVLINAVHQDGQQEHAPPRVLRLAASLAALMPVPLVVIAAYALGLRVAQHGWTSDRIIAAACLVVASCYALGYAWAALRQGRWLERIEICNVVAAFLMLAALLALFTPIADPARLSVASQVARLESGAVPPDKFDFAYLRFDGARYGKAALERLSKIGQGAQAADIRRRALAALAQQNRWQQASVPPTAQELAANLKVYPPGRVLPASFLDERWSALGYGGSLPQCLTAADAKMKCDVVIVDLDGDGQDEVLVLEPWRIVVLAQDGKGEWLMSGLFDGPVSCASVREALRAGRFEPMPQRGRDLEVDGLRLRFVSPPDNSRCP